MDALRQEYENGMFPENTLTLVENESQVPDGDTLAYTKDTGCFYLPAAADIAILLKLFRL